MKNEIESLINNLYMIKKFRKNNDPFYFSENDDEIELNKLIDYVMEFYNKKILDLLPDELRNKITSINNFILDNYSNSDNNKINSINTLSNLIYNTFSRFNGIKHTNLYTNQYETILKEKEESIIELRNRIENLQNNELDKQELETLQTKLNNELNEKEKYKLKATELDKYLNETEKINQAIIKLKAPAIELIESKKIFETNRDNYNEYAMSLFKIAIVAFIFIILNLFFFVGINDLAKSEKGINLSFYLINVFPILFPTILGFLFIRQSNMSSQEVEKINRRFILIHEVNQSLQALVEVNRGKEMDNKTEKIIDKLIENILNYASENNSINKNQESSIFGLNESIDKLIDTIDKKLTVIGKPE